MFKVWKSIFKINLVKEEENKEISVLKVFGNLIQYFPKLSFEIFKGEFYISRILKSILSNFIRFGIKSKKNHKKTAFDILKFIKLKTFEAAKIVI